MWIDYLVAEQRQLFDFQPSASNYFPLWADPSLAQGNEDAIIQSFLQSGLMQIGGIQTTTVNTTQQWDSPNAWAPIQYAVIQGFTMLNSTTASRLASQLTCAWIETTYLAWNATQLMYEKYDAFVPGEGGGGGEYMAQTGFGWTNGLVLAILADENLSC